MHPATTHTNDLTLEIKQGDLLPPEQHRYRMLGPIGEGAFSKVWLAQDTYQEGRSYVAMKIDAATKVSGPSMETLTLRKLRSLQRSSKHPGADNVIHLLDDFVMQLPGRSGLYHSCVVTEVVIALDRWVRMRNRSRLMLPLFNAFAFLHAHGIAHGDPHENNVGVVVKGLDKVSEHSLESMLRDEDDWLVILEYINGDGSTLVPSDGAHADLRLFDFGRAYETSTASGDLRSRLPGNNPNRPPEVYIYRMINGALGAEWSFASDIWALACTLNEVCREHTLEIPPCDNTNLNESILPRCAPGGPPPPEWLKYCDFGTNLLKIFERVAPWKPPRSFIENPNSLNAIQQGLEVLTERFWHSESQRLQQDPAELPMVPFSDMVRGMMATDPRKRSTMPELLEHPFWQQFAEAVRVGKVDSGSRKE